MEGRSVPVEGSTVTLGDSKPVLVVDTGVVRTVVLYGAYKLGVLGLSVALYLARQEPDTVYKQVYKCKTGTACKASEVDNTADNRVKEVDMNSDSNWYRKELLADK